MAIRSSTRHCWRRLDDPRIDYEFLPEIEAELSPETAARYDAVCVMLAQVTRKTVSGANRRLKLIARFGVGYDTVDVPALTDSGVILTITPDGVRRPVASSALTFVLMLAHRVAVKDRLVRDGRWADRVDHMGTGLSGRTLGSIGVGNIGSELFRLAMPFAMRHLGCDPYITQESVAPLGVKLVDLDTLLREADFLCVNCPLNEETRHLVGAKQFALMKPTAYFINTARGPIVDEKALYAALANERIAGAAIDVFEQEPTPPDNPLAQVGQFDRYAASHLPDRRVHQHGDRQCVQRLPRSGLRTRAEERGESASAGRVPYFHADGIRLEPSRLKHHL